MRLGDFDGLNDGFVSPYDAVSVGSADHGRPDIVNDIDQALGAMRLALGRIERLITQAELKLADSQVPIGIQEFE